MTISRFFFFLNIRIAGRFGDHLHGIINNLPLKKQNFEEIFFIFFPDILATNEENLIRKAMSTFEEKSCVRFVPRDEHETFIRFQKEKSGCYAPIGRLPGNSGSLPVNLQVSGQRTLKRPNYLKYLPESF